MLGGQSSPSTGQSGEQGSVEKQAGLCMEGAEMQVILEPSQLRDIRRRDVHLVVAHSP